MSTVTRRFQRFVWLGRRQRTIGPAALAHPRRLRLQRRRPGPHIHSFSPILALLAHSSSLVTTVPYCPVCLPFLRLCAYPLSLLRPSSLSFLRSIHSLIPTTFTPHPPSLPAWHCCYSTLRTTTVCRSTKPTPNRITTPRQPPPQLEPSPSHNKTYLLCRTNLVFEYIRRSSRAAPLPFRSVPLPKVHCAVHTGSRYSSIHFTTTRNSHLPTSAPVPSLLHSLALSLPHIVL